MSRLLYNTRQQLSNKKTRLRHLKETLQKYIAPEFELLEHNAIMDTFRQLYREEIGVALK